MMAKCKNITSRINDLENRVKSIHKSKSSLSEEYPKRPSTAPSSYNRRNSRLQLAHLMINQMQKQIKTNSDEGSPRYPESIKCLPERESDATNIEIHKSPSLDRLQDETLQNKEDNNEWYMNNPFSDTIAEIGEVTVMDMVNKFPGEWPIVNSPHNIPFIQEVPPSEDTKIMDNLLIDGLRGEIDKVRNKLCEIGKRPCDTPEINLDYEKKEIDEPIPNDNCHSILVTKMNELQRKNDCLVEELEIYRSFQEKSMKKAEETESLITAYESKVNALQEQSLKSSKIMIRSKQRFCDISKKRNAQIKNLFHVNQQLKKALSINREQINELNFNYKLLKANYKQLEKSDETNKRENIKFRETMVKLEEELKFVYKECTSLKQDNIRFLKKLATAKDEVARKYSSNFEEHEECCQIITSKNVATDRKIIQEVDDISQNIHSQVEGLFTLRSEAKNGSFDLELKYRNLSYEYEILVRRFREYEQFDEIKCRCLEQELKEFTMRMQERESIILRERDELRMLVEELANKMRTNKDVINELKSSNEQREHNIEDLEELIKIKDRQMLRSQEEHENFRKDYENLKNEITFMKIVLNDKEKNCSPGDVYSKELQNLRDTINRENENNSIKQKIIEDHEITIDSLKGQIKEKSIEIESKVQSICRMRNDLDNLTETLKCAESDLEKEKHEKMKIMKELENISLYKETLIRQICDLENVVKQRCKDDEINEADQREVIEKFERDMRNQKECWDIERKLLEKDKEKAMHAAKFASQKLLDTVSDFQKQMYQQKSVQTKLAILLHDKEEQLESLTKKVGTLLPPQNVMDNETLNTIDLSRIVTAPTK